MIYEKKREKNYWPAFDVLKVLQKLKSALRRPQIGERSVNELLGGVLNQRNIVSKASHGAFPSSLESFIKNIKRHGLNSVEHVLDSLEDLIDFMNISRHSC